MTDRLYVYHITYKSTRSTFNVLTEFRSSIESRAFDKLKELIKQDWVRSARIIRINVCSDEPSIEVIIQVDINELGYIYAPVGDDLLWEYGILGCDENTVRISDVNIDAIEYKTIDKQIP